MNTPKQTKNLNGERTHYSVGAIIKRNGKYLLIDRVNPPLGFAALAGHVDEGESEDDALVREVLEESGLTVLGHRLLGEEEIPRVICVYGVPLHHWYVYECEVSGEIKKEDAEAKSIGWYSRSEMKKLIFEPSWDYWFKKLGII